MAQWEWGSVEDKAFDPSFGYQCSGGYLTRFSGTGSNTYSIFQIWKRSEVGKGSICIITFTVLPQGIWNILLFLPQRVSQKMELVLLSGETRCYCADILKLSNNGFESSEDWLALKVQRWLINLGSLAITPFSQKEATHAHSWF